MCVFVHTCMCLCVICRMGKCLGEHSLLPVIVASDSFQSVDYHCVCVLEKRMGSNHGKSSTLCFFFYKSLQIFLDIV